MKKSDIFNLHPLTVPLLVAATVTIILTMQILKKHDNKNTPDQDKITQTETPAATRDTLRIVGGPRQSFRASHFFITLVDKQGHVFTKKYHNGISKPQAPLLTSFERGDTVVMENGEIIENLTQKRLINEFATRQR